VGGSDSHLLSTIGLGFTEIDSRPDESSVLESIRNGKTRSGGKVIPPNIIMIHAVRALVRKMRRRAGELNSKIFHIET